MIAMDTLDTLDSKEAKHISCNAALAFDSDFYKKMCHATHKSCNKQRLRGKKRPGRETWIKEYEKEGL